MRANIIHIAMALAIALTLSGCDKHGDSQKAFSAAKQAQAQGNTKVAIIELKNALQKNPDNAEARALLGSIYVQQGDGASAEKELRKAIALGLKSDALLPDLAQALFLQFQFQKVVDETQPVLTAPAAERARLLVTRGNAELMLGHPDNAKAAFDQAKTLAPNQAETYLSLANLALAQGRSAEVTALINTALAKEPKRAATWVMQGDWLRLQGKNDEAIVALQHAIKLDPNASKARSALASIYIGADNFDMARAEVAALSKIDTQQIESRYLSALIDFREKKYTAARDTLQTILKAVPNHPPSMQLAAATAIALGDYGQAEQQLLTLLQRYPQNAYARKLLATSQLQSRQPEKALATLKPLLGDTQRDAQVWTLAGEANLQLKQYAQSTVYFERAAQADPKNAAVRTELGMSRYASGDVQQALGDLDLASNLSSDTGRADVMRVLAYTNKRQWDDALKAVASLEKKQPNSPITHNLRGAIYLGKNQNALARSSFEKALALDSGYFPAAMNLARLDMQDKQPAAARKRFEAVLAKDKNNMQAMLALSALESEAGHDKEMLEWLNKAAVSHKEAIQPRVLLARYYLQKKDFIHALAVAREAVSANPNSPDALDLLGSTQMNAGEKDNAVTSFSRLTALSPDLPGAWLRLGQAQDATKSTDQARSSYQKALNLKPDLIEAELALARLEFNAGRKTEALKWVQKVQQQQPKQALGFMLEGELLQTDKQYQKALEKYEQAFALSKTPDMLIRIHGVLILQGRGAEGEARLLQWAKDHPKETLVRLYLGDMYLKQGKMAAAAQQYQAVLAQFPTDLMALNNLAFAYQQMKDPRAVEVAERAYAQAPNKPDVADTLGWALVQMGDAKRGLSLLQQAHAKSPEDGTIHYHYAVALLKNSDKPHAQAELERLSALNVKFSEEAEAKALLKQIKAGGR